MQDILRAMSRHDGPHSFIPLHGLFSSNGQDIFVPPVPMSEMNVEELMHILPSLDAAIIAHDWLPCMQARHCELKTSLQEKAGEALDANLRIQQFTDKLQDIINSSGVAAATWMDMVHIAEEHQKAERAVTEMEAELARTKAQKEEVVSVLARHVSRHKQMCEEHTRGKADLMARCEEILEGVSGLLSDDMTEMTRKDSLIKLTQLRGILDQTYKDEPRRSTLSAKVNLAGSTAHEEEMRRLLYAQQKTLARQSSDLDKFVDLVGKATGTVRDKDKEIEKLKAVNLELQRRFNQRSERLSPTIQENISVCDSSWHVVESPESEMSSLRWKLEKAYHREQQLQLQLIQLMQAADKGTPCDKPDSSSRFRRFLTRNFRDQNSSILPRSSSMQNLSLFTSTSPTEVHSSLERRASSNSSRTIRPAPSSASSSTSNATDPSVPSVGSICDPTTGETEWSNQPPRVREAVHEQQNGAITLPSHVRTRRASSDCASLVSAVKTCRQLEELKPATGDDGDTTASNNVQLSSSNLDETITRRVPSPPLQHHKENSSNARRTSHLSSVPLLSAESLSQQQQRQHYSSGHSYFYPFATDHEPSYVNALQPSSQLSSQVQTGSQSQHQTRPSTRVLSGITEVSEESNYGGRSRSGVSTS